MSPLRNFQLSDEKSDIKVVTEIVIKKYLNGATSFARNGKYETITYNTGDLIKLEFKPEINDYEVIECHTHDGHVWTKEHGQLS